VLAGRVSIPRVAPPPPFHTSGFLPRILLQSPLGGRSVSHYSEKTVRPTSSLDSTPRMLARAVRPDIFIMARLGRSWERIPLVADFNAGQGTVTVVIQAVGKTTIEMMALPRRRLISISSAAGGCPATYGNWMHRGAGGRRPGPRAHFSPNCASTRTPATGTISIVGFRNRDLMFWEDHSAGSAMSLIVTRPDDGSYGSQRVRPHTRSRRHRRQPGVREVVAIGPAFP